MYALMDAFDMAFVAKKYLEEILDAYRSITKFTYSKQVFDSFICGKRTAERSLSIDIMAARESYRNFEIECIGLVRGDVNPADGLTKTTCNDARRRILETGVANTPVEQWIVRESTECEDTHDAYETAGKVVGEYGAGDEKTV